LENGKVPGRTQKEGSNSEKTTKVPALLARMSVRVIAATRPKGAWVPRFRPARSSQVLVTSGTHDDERVGVILPPTAIPQYHTFSYYLGLLRQHWVGPVDVFSAIQVSCPAGWSVVELAEYKCKNPRDKLFKMRLTGKPTGHLTYGQN
jgi:hypothetical protein